MFILRISQQKMRAVEEELEEKKVAFEAELVHRRAVVCFLF